MKKMITPQILLGFKGREIIDAGYVYAPYIPLTSNPTIDITNFLHPLGTFKIRGLLYKIKAISGHDYNDPNLPIRFWLDVPVRGGNVVADKKGNWNPAVGLGSKKYIWEINKGKSYIIDSYTERRVTLKHHEKILKYCLKALRDFGKK